MTVVLAGVVAGVIALIGMPLVLHVWNRPPHMRKNFRDRDVVGTAGAVLIKITFFGWLVSLIEGNDRVALAMAAAGVAMGVLGYIDDLYGDRRAGGLFGHARALLKGELTTGMLKAIGGAVVGLGAAWLVGWQDVWVIAAGAVVALSSNLANLFDLRPGRVIKIWVPLAVWAVVALETEASRAVGVAVIAGAVVFVVWELAERVMLGDTGAGLLGAVLGVAAIAVLERPEVLVTGSILLAVTLLSEVVSFSRVIEVVPPLRWLDRLGRRRS